MSSERYYVRIRGRVTGPFDIPQLAQLVERGTLSRIHEVSVDQVSWTSAGSLEVLFPTASPLPVEIQPSAEAASLPTDTPRQTNEDNGTIPLVSLGEPVEAPPEGTLERRYYYAQGSAMMGPVSLAELRSLARSRKLRPDDLICQEGDTGWLPAHQSEVLALVFRAR